MCRPDLNPDGGRSKGLADTTRPQSELPVNAKRFCRLPSTNSRPNRRMMIERRPITNCRLCTRVRVTGGRALHDPLRCRGELRSITYRNPAAPTRRECFSSPKQMADNCRQVELHGAKERISQG